MLYKSCVIVPIFVLLGFGESYKLFLFFPFPGKSHSILGEGLVKILLDAGHEITYVTRYPIENQPPRLHQINLTSEFQMSVSQTMVMSSSKAKRGLNYIPVILNAMIGIAKTAVMNEDIQSLILDEKQQFDAVIAEWMFSEIYVGFSAVFNCPLIWSSTMIPHSMILSTIGEEINPAYNVANFLSRNILPLSFWDRMDELSFLIYSKYYRWKLSCNEAEVYSSVFRTAVEKRGRILPSYFKIKYNASLILGNSHVSTSDISSLPLNYISIGGYHINKIVKPLPQNLKEIMDNATNGVIYFTMGSMLTSKHFPITVKQSFLNMFGALNHTVIWKLDEDLPNLPKNVYSVEWAPQQSILAHPNCILLITHGGLLSVTESLHFGVPIIGLPVFGDQYNNINRAVYNGYGIKVEFGYDCVPNVHAAILKITNNPSYLAKAKEMSFIFHHRPVPPSKELLYWVEHVIKTEGAPLLRSPGFDLPWYKRIFIDIALVILVVLAILYALTRYALLFRINNKYVVKTNY